MGRAVKSWQFDFQHLWTLWDGDYPWKRREVVRMAMHRIAARFYLETESWASFNKVVKSVQYSWISSTCFIEGRILKWALKIFRNWSKADYSKELNHRLRQLLNKRFYLKKNQKPISVLIYWAKSKASYYIFSKHRWIIFKRFSRKFKDCFLFLRFYW